MICSIVEIKGDFRKLRERVVKDDPPLIVPITILLRDLISIYEEPILYKDTDFVNFAKIRQVYGIYELIERTKESSYAFQPVSSIQTFLSNLKPLPEDKLNALFIQRKKDI